MYTRKAAPKFIALIALFIASTLLLGPSVNAAGGNKANFKWKYVYNAGQNVGTLTVDLYNQTCSAKTATLNFPSTCSVKKGHIECDVDIQEAANQSLVNEGFSPFAPSAQSYPSIFTEVTGSFQGGLSNGNHTIVDHPSLTYKIQSNGATKSVKFKTNWSGTQASSNPFGYSKNTPYTMNTSFSPNKFHHMVDNSANRGHGTSASQLPFQLNDTTFKFYQPQGFTLDEFIVDPGQCGFG